ncbi:hypothetical protein IFM89_011153 [Coptis chinensis]|uniref:U5 small nuclear ribonucleoprotein TSSC4 n=1 Tax=Coptis chinensis TaxID=261450 RepID=A0A835LZ85_9MAGN|nr:hypothetical protein IFM89_011153 [Coptis chinensis]
MSMEESFSVRVDKVFGSLSKPVESSSLWSLTDQEIRKKEWNRERGVDINNNNNCSSSERKNFLDDEDLDDLDDKGDFDIRSSIGLDRTLDNEEEEDEYDKVALGRENTGDRLYMKDITDYGEYLNSYNVLPDSFKDRERDSRANLLAAKIRLKEDEEASGVDTFSDVGQEMPGFVDSPVTEDGGNLKSILKRKETLADSKSRKRVRFDPACKDSSEEELEGTQDSAMINYSMETTTVAEDTCPLPQGMRGIPDHVQNPSKYTHYSFDSSSKVDESSNRQAYSDLFNMIKNSSSIDSQLEPPANLPESVTFIPKKKTDDATTVNQSHNDASKESQREGFAPGIAASEVEENGACAMEEDEPEMTTENSLGQSHKPGRQYRSKARPDDTVS